MSFAERILAYSVEAVDIGNWKSNAEVIDTLKGATAVIQTMKRPPLNLGAYDGYYHKRSTGNALYVTPKGSKKAIAAYEFTNTRSVFRDLASVPHAAVASAYQGKGITSSVYAWAMKHGVVFITGGVQTRGANKLWYAMAKRGYKIVHFYSVGKTYSIITPEQLKANPKLKTHYMTNMLLGEESAVDRILSKTKRFRVPLSRKIIGTEERILGTL